MGKEASLFSYKTNKQLRGWRDLLSTTPLLQDRAQTLFCLFPFNPPNDTVHPIACVFLLKKRSQMKQPAAPLEALFAHLLVQEAPTLCLNIEREFF